MKPVQIKINIADGKIAGVTNTPGEISLVSEHSSKTIIDAWLYPGFVDAHGHIVALGQKLNSLNLNDCRSVLDCVEKAKGYKERRGSWLVGRGWNHENWEEKKYPSKELLDIVFPDIPVSFTRVDGHALWVNSYALRLAGINENTVEPSGGTISRNVQGEPTGILIDNAMSLISKLLPPHSQTVLEKFIIAANEELLKAGITEVHDMDVKPSHLPVFKRLDEKGRLGIRVQSFVKAQNDEWLTNDVRPYHGNKFNVVGVKFYADGALGSHGAAMFQPYSDKPDTKGLMLLDEKELFDKATKAIKAGFHVATHAIGDAANNMVLNVYAKLRDRGIADDSVILRIEHAQILKPEDIIRLAQYKIFASMQPVHCLSDAPMARKRIGDRVRNSYLWNSLMSAGVVIAGGSDFPIESHEPLTGLNAFIHRVPFGESKAWVSGERIMPEQAIDAYTINAHILSGNEKNRGQIQKHFATDFTLLNKNITKLSHLDFESVEVVATVIDGKFVFINDKYKTA